MKRNKCFAVVAFLLGTTIFAAAYRSDMSGSDVLASGTVLGALNQVEASLVRGQYNRALVQLRSVKAQVGGVMLPSVSVFATSDVSPVVTPVVVPVVPGATTPVPPAVVSVATLPGVVPAVPAPATVFAYEPYSSAKFTALKKEIDTLVQPFDVIDDLWGKKPADCVAQYQAQLDLCVKWVMFYRQLFAKSEWKSLADYFYNNVLDSSSALKNPLKLKSWSGGIHGAAYSFVYDYVISRLETIKNNLNAHVADIDALKAKILVARDDASVGKSEGNSWW